MAHDVSEPSGAMLEVEVNAVSTNRKAAMRFHVASVQRPLASAVKVVEAGNRIVMAKSGAYIENEATGEKMPLRIERGTFVFDVMYTGGQSGTITLDSGAGVNVWPESLLQDVPMGPPDAGLRMTAANGTLIPSKGTKVIEFTPASGGSRHA
jgi:fatty acid/phospholipid biosynthesis enzyme